MGWSLFGRKKKVFHLLGDSHILGLEGLGKLLPEFEVKTCYVPGATASGLQNPHSKTLAGPIINKYIDEQVRKNDLVLVHLGEVDCGFLMWVRAERNNISIEEQTEATLGNYFSLLKKISGRGAGVYVMSIVPQTIKDGSTFGNVANLRGQIKATQLERTALSRKMNARLRDFATENQMQFVDLDADLIDEATGIVKDHYLNENPEDHHLSSSKLVELLAVKIKPLLR